MTVCVQRSLVLHKLFPYFPRYNGRVYGSQGSFLLVVVVLRDYGSADFNGLQLDNGATQT